ncbi:hypothetical protein EVAR_60151_1 [Eumeta japonica]|uniref:Uncharacterized protein n=1 Tax=Eumeta variegata TaxID=151549 RepID=A0A4C2A3Q6_EUMVA|nr:hypothetical protein EVAR_60151_1 [Eumeta japonica]
MAAYESTARALLSDGSREGRQFPACSGEVLHAAGGRCALRAAFAASCLRGALPPVDLRAVCFAGHDRLLHNTPRSTNITHESLLLTERCGRSYKACDTTVARTGVRRRPHTIKFIILRLLLHPSVRPSIPTLLSCRSYGFSR